tara:strand:+ start:11642 stop:12106 length:465 start_codon:yes stop_codon:yes gene_type:complete
MSKRNKIKAGLTASLNKLKFIVPKVITNGVRVGRVDVIVKKHSNRHIYYNLYRNDGRRLAMDVILRTTALALAHLHNHSNPPQAEIDVLLADDQSYKAKYYDSLHFKRLHHLATKDKDTFKIDYYETAFYNVKDEARIIKERIYQNASKWCDLL